LLAAPIDFATRDRLLNVWTQPEYFNVDKFVDALGNCPPQLLQSILCLMRFLDPAGQWLHLPPRRKIGIFAPVPASKAAPQTGVVLYVFGGWRESVFKPSTLMKKLENTV
jgi:hypothetical protein